MTRPTLRVWFGEYVTSQLAIDVISLVPFDIVFWNPRLRMLGIFRLVRLVRLPRIFQRCAIFRQAQNKIEEIIGIGASKTLPIAFCIFCFMHFNACATYYTAKLSGFVGWESVWPQFAGASTVQVYTWTMFQAVGNLFPMSFKPQTTAEQVVAICFIIAGAILYAAFVGYISSAAVSVNPSGRLYNQKMEELIDYVKWKKLSPTTRDKLVSYYEIKYRGKYFEEESLLADMNESLREEVSSHNTRRLIEKVVFLRRCEGDGRDDIFFNKMSTVLHARYYIPGDYVTKQGDSGNDMFFILSGKVNVSVNGVKVVSLYDEAYFGEVSLITKSLRTATVQAGMASILYRLTRQDFQSVISEFEDMQERILELAEEGQRLVPQPKQASRWDVQT
ncbi:cyclic nucleotide-binding-like protein [Chytriomyces sp. MP71]|nr:cyclic nucleotide-binding-like protein [Chytriomyces sp. MP71]